MNHHHCTICELRCRLVPGQPGACGLYEWQNGNIVERYPDRFLVICPISIETMPMLHFRPGSKFLQITTTGCNFNCPGCISTTLVKAMSPDSKALHRRTADEVVAEAIRSDCEGIVFLMNDPLAAFPRFLRIAELAHHQGLEVGCSSNAYFTPESLSQLLPFLDFINIGMKGFTDAAYKACGAPSLRPVLRNLAALHGAGVHIEMSCILTRHNAAELLELARHMGRLSRCMPLQVMRFLPFENAGIDLEPSIREAEDFCLTARQSLDYVYLFNTPGSDSLHTRCPHCGHVILRREFYGPMGAKLKTPKQGLPVDNSCPACPHLLPIVGPPAAATYQEGDFEGGYPLTRAMEIVEAMLIAMGVTRRDVVVAAWEEILQDGGLKRLHQSIQRPRDYIATLRDFGRKAGVPERAETLAAYLEKQLARVADAWHRPNAAPGSTTPWASPVSTSTAAAWRISWWNWPAASASTGRWHRADGPATT
ncbi:radical SAM protein [Desulfosarcina cetonica]|uniref:radical SAM protein n=1 Tax=Desulfosarcina cetonica TaxID=90730 RepID=UPI000AEF2F01|nr:radical SAM protein [Desulfosarcina cetonica]